MTNDNLSVWLKAAAENKITTKNTWKSNLIDYFSDMKEFQEHHGTNFQKASSTLDGCVKVFSTRVDDVTEDTNKLLLNLNKEDATKAKKTNKRLGADTLEKDTNKLNIKNIETDGYFNIEFRRIFKNKKPMVDYLCPSGDGQFRVVGKGEGLVMEFVKPIKEYGGLEKMITPTLKELEKGFEFLLSQEIESNEANYEIHEMEYTTEHNDLSEYNNDLSEYNNDLSKTEYEDTSIIKPTTFSYFKGWAGPSHWIIRKKNPQGKKEREKFYIDFTSGTINPLIKGCTLYSKEEIEGRRSKTHHLPEDYRFERSDLYKYMMKDGYFHGATNDNTIINNINDNTSENIIATQTENMSNNLNDMSIDNTTINNNHKTSVLIEDEMITDLGNIKRQGLTQHLFLKYTKVPKKVNILKLKENLFNSLKNKKEIGLLDILGKEIPLVYSNEKERKDISMHYCVISLLHLANEKNIGFEVKNNKIIVKLDGLNCS
ncbi:Condensin complex subunit 2 [Astathelohania contejeani]|uniref:Condensin complex subunit 2 n=1 Tax=Astathelohania contejeani TaxID=164912 RepID=A0ABQ7HZZ3_9MICR|nr:Condensin complex subunit 2 [Thelohania contejeani]